MGTGIMAGHEEKGWIVSRYLVYLSIRNTSCLYWHFGKTGERRVSTLYICVSIKPILNNRTGIMTGHGEKGWIVSRYLVYYNKKNTVQPITLQ